VGSAPCAGGKISAIITLQEAVLFYADPDNCLDFLMARRPEWKDGVVCPTRGSKNVAFLKSRRLWHCKTRHPKAQFSIKVGTIFEDSPIVWTSGSLPSG